MKGLLRAFVAVALVGPLLAGCSSRSVRAGEARVEPHGAVRVAKPGGSYTTLTKARTMKTDVRVLVDTGSATVRLATAELDLRPTTEVRLGPGQPELLAGELLVVPGRRVLTVTAAGSALSITGAARMSRTFSVSTGSYEGSVQIASAGSKLAVPALRQATVPALGQVPNNPEPLRYDAADKWDRRFLADAIDLGTELQARSDAANAQFRGQGTTPGFYRILMPQLGTEPAFDGSLLQPSRSPGENLIGAGIATVSKQGDFRARWDGIFTFRGQGAAWGLVALEQGVLRVPGLLTTIDDALGRARLPGEPAAVAIGVTGVTTTTTAPAGTAPTTTVTTGPRGTTSTTRGTTGGSSTTTTQPPIVAVPHVPPTGQPAVDQLVNPTVDTINGLLPRKP